ncbi:MAG TPA: hypothetical protein VKF36_14615 [Syntrophorhabdales bacterium]|nr:hypothetical protein [Syntrophorhabdales bacterium]
MKRLMIGLALVIFAIYTAPGLACDCDTAAAITSGLKDRLHQPWSNDPQGSKEKDKDSDKGFKQEAQPMNQDAQSTKGEVKR